MINGEGRAERPVTTDAPAVQSIVEDDLPVGRTEIELSSPPSRLVLAEPSPRIGKILALIRLHTYPLGIVVLDGRVDRSWATHAPTVWSAMREAVNAHLAADLDPPVDAADLYSRAIRPVVRCQQRRAEVLTAAPHITVVVATRERPDSLRSCLFELLDLEYPSYDIVVVDNEPVSTRTAELVARFPEWVRYVREDRSGLAFSHNRGLEEVRGTIAAFIDDDVLVDRHWLTGIAEGFAAADGVGCVTGLIMPAQLETPAQLLWERHSGSHKGFGLRVFDSQDHRRADPFFPFTAGRLGSGINMAFDTAVIRDLGGFDPAVGSGDFARGADDLEAFFSVVLRHRAVYQPAAIVWHRHQRDMAALRNQAFGCGVGLGAYLTSVMVREPRMWPYLLRRLPSGLAEVFRSSSARNSGWHDGWPSARLEKRGTAYGPAAYAVSRWRTRHRAVVL